MASFTDASIDPEGQEAGIDPVVDAFAAYRLERLVERFLEFHLTRADAKAGVAIQLRAAQWGRPQPHGEEARILLQTEAGHQGRDDRLRHPGRQLIEHFVAGLGTDARPALGLDIVFLHRAAKGRDANVGLSRLEFRARQPERDRAVDWLAEQNP